MSETYTRGTKTIRIKTARLIPGDRVLTQPATVWDTGDDGKYRVIEGSIAVLPHPDPHIVQAAQTKTDAIVRAVERLEAVLQTGGRRRAQRFYTVYFTDGTRALNNSPIYTWNALDVDRASSASRQHFVDTGAYLTAAEVAEFEA